MHIPRRPFGGGGDLPPDLRLALSAARAELTASPAGLVPRPNRWQVYLALGPADEIPEVGHMGAGWRRRAELDLLATERAAGDDGHPAAADALRLIETCRAVLDERASHADLQRFTRDLMAHVDGLTGAADPLVQAALETKAQCVGDRIAPGETVPEHDDRMADAWDAAYLAAAAVTPGEPPYASPGADRRRAFWDWWLATAVPLAWRAA